MRRAFRLLPVHATGTVQVDGARLTRGELSPQGPA